MKSDLIYKYIKSDFNFCGSSMIIPNHIKKEIKEIWDELLLSGKEYVNGELFSISKIKNDKSNLIFDVDKTTYDHYLYSVKKEFNGEYICRPLASNILPITTDGYYVLGIMSDKTSLSNKIKFIGGAVSNEDIKNGQLSPIHCVKREVYEEVGLNLDSQGVLLQMEPAYFLTRRNLSFINVLFYSKLNLSSHQIKEIFQKHKEKLLSEEKEVEIESIFLLSNEKNEIKSFLSEYQDRVIDYMPELFLVLIDELDAKDMVEEIKKNCRKDEK